MTDVNTITIEAQSFQDMYEELETLRTENEKLILENERLNRMVTGVKLNNSRLTKERNDLIDKVHFLDEKCNAYHKEVLDIIHMDMWEFANNYCTDAQIKEAGHQLARSLLGGK